MILYGYHKCTTCKKAANFLKKENISFTFIEITKEPPSIKELNKMVTFMGSLKSIFNTSGEIYRKMQLKDKIEKISLDESLKLLSEHGMLIKRPFLIGPDFGMVGFNEAKWIKKFKNDTCN